MSIRNLKPQNVWGHFYSLTQIPRPSKKEAKAVEFLVKFGENLGLETYKDEVGNVIIRKPASPGMEDRKGIILQAHIDMVPQKNSDKVHDFEKDPIQARIVEDWVYATGTTLGADNGLGVAVALAVLEDKNMVNGPIEAFITIDEETGMTGARAIKPGVLKGEILINLDSEDEGELYIGCAGGLDATATLKYKEEPIPTGLVTSKISVQGLTGGHSGMDIILCRANANKVLIRILLPMLRDMGVRLASVDGGSLRNAIPREAFADVLIPMDKLEEANDLVAKILSEVKSEYAKTDPDIDIKIDTAAMPANIIDVKSALTMVLAAYACPNGVERMSDEMPGMVETSNNMAIFKSEKGKLIIKSLMRSSADTAKDAFAESLKSVFVLAGAEVEFSGGYPGWKPNTESPILKTMQDVYKAMYGKIPEVKAIHAGLECGILGGVYPNWDMISCGPTIRSPHSPDERVEIATVEKWWNFVVEVLKNAPKK